MKLYLPRQKLTMNETLIFFKIVPLSFNSVIAVSFPLVKAPLKLFFWHGMKQQHLNVFYILKFYLWDKFSVKQTRESHIEELGHMVSIEHVSLEQSCILPKPFHSKKHQDWLYNYFSNCHYSNAHSFFKNLI